MIADEGVQILFDGIADALYATSEQQSHTHDFDVLGDTVEEGAISWTFTVSSPVFNILEAAEDGLCALIDALLDFIKEGCKTTSGT